MKIKFLILGFTLFTGVACSSQKSSSVELYYDSDNFISLDINFVNNIQSFLTESKKNTLTKEKEAFINRKIDNPEYLSNLDLYTQYNNQVDEDFNRSFIMSIIKKRKNNINVKNIFMLSIFLSGESFNKMNIIIIENFDGTAELFNSEGRHKVFLNRDIIEFSNEFMLNLPYSFDNKTPSMDGHFTMYKIAASNANKYKVTSAIATEVLNYQLEIIKKIYEAK